MRPGSTPDISASLRERADVARLAASRLARSAERVSIGRLAATVSIVVAAAAAIGEPRHRSAFWIVTALAFATLIALARWNQRLEAQRHRASARAQVSEQGAFRADRAWSQLDAQPWTWEEADSDEPLRADLDVAGRESLVQLLPTISTGVGAPRLRDWFATNATTEELLQRQACVRELVDDIELRDAFELCARQVRLSESQIGAFVEWGRADAQPESGLLRVASVVLPVLTLVSIGASTRWPATATLAMISIFATASLAGLVRSRTRDAVRAADVGARIAAVYADLASRVIDAKFRTPRLQELQTRLGGGGSSRADHALQTLSRVSVWAEVRSSPMLHAALQALFAWDTHITRVVERWRVTNGRAFGEWFSAFAELECLAALAGLAYTNPTWTFPDLSPQHPLRIQARTLAHPLLPASGSIANDVDIGPPGTVLLISGSNMSGKSTLLRAIGLNVLLARLGGPVCAQEMSCPPVRLFTSLRVQDSLADGVSYFMAEAMRLRDIVFAAEEPTADGAPPVLYLVDEILRGTNSEERAVAARFIVARLLNTSAIGVITTHDLAIFDDPALATRVRHAHFAERFVGNASDERLAFDYRLQAGPTTSRNALRLLSLIGLSPT